jgi:nucleotide-binding universal stress UspA family protein
MKLKDLFVLLDAENDAAGRYALGLAEKLDAALTAVAAVIEPRLPGYVSAEFSSSFVAKIHEEAEDAARAVLSRFAQQRPPAVALDLRPRKALAGDVGLAVGHWARYHDLAILSQREFGRGDATDIIEGALFGAGRPILIVPYIFKGPVKLGTVLVAWDGSQTAARTLADALPLLTAAQRVEVVTVAEPSDETVARAHADIVRHLARHGIAAEPRTLFSVGDVANTLLSHAADSGADLLVMGGYGHSRLRELVLGGTTRDILRSMTVPVLMAH